MTSHSMQPAIAENTVTPPILAPIAVQMPSKVSVGAGYSLEVVKSIAEVHALREEWQALPRDPNADLDFYLTVIESHEEILRPHVIVVRREGVVKAMVVGRLERKRLEVALGYRKVSTRPIRFLMLIHGGALGEDSDELASPIVASIMKTMRDGEADIVWFYGLEQNSALYRAARKAGSPASRDFFPTRLGRWRGRIPPTYEALLRQLSPNARHNLKRYAKRLQATYGEQLSIRNFRRPDDLETVLSDTEAIASRTYHRGLGVGFANNAETRQLMALAANQGWLRACVLYIAGKPVAFWNGFLYRRTFYTWTTGYDRDLSELRPGTFLLQKMFEELCAEKAADEVDFGFGDAQYKRDWCDHEQVQASFMLFAPTLQGIALNCFRTPLMATSKLVRNVLARTGAMQSLKKKWRARLAQAKG